MTDQFKFCGFQKESVNCSRSGIQYELYRKDLNEVIRQQLSKTPLSELFLSSPSKYITAPPMKAEIGGSAVPAAEKMNKESKDWIILWEEKSRDIIELIIGCLQLFFDKSHLSMSAGSFILCPLHVTLLNFSEEQRRVYMKSDMIVCAYLRIHFDWTFSNTKNKDHEFRKKKKISSRTREHVLRALHQDIRSSQNNLKRAALKDLKCRTIDNNHVLLHLMLFSYIADIPDSQNFLSVRRGTRSLSPFHTCFKRKGDFGRNRKGEK